MPTIELIINPEIPTKICAAIAKIESLINFFAKKFWIDEIFK